MVQVETMTGDGQAGGYRLTGTILVDEGEDRSGVRAVGGFRAAGRGGQQEADEKEEAGKRAPHRGHRTDRRHDGRISGWFGLGRTHKVATRFPVRRLLRSARR